MAHRKTERNPLFAGRWFEDDIILLCLRWYFRFKLSYRDLVAILAERGLPISHTAILRWVVRYAETCEKRTDPGGREAFSRGRHCGLAVYWGRTPEILGAAPGRRRPHLQGSGLAPDADAILRWVVRYAETCEKRWHRFERPVGRSWRVDETFIKVRGQWMYLYRAVDGQGNTVEFYLSRTRGIAAAKAFFRKALKHHREPHSITLDDHQPSHSALRCMGMNGEFNFRGRKPVTIRCCQYLNNVVEQDHRWVKGRLRPMLGFKTPLGEGAITPDAGVQDILQCATRDYRHRTGPEDSQTPVRNSGPMAVESRRDLASRHGRIGRIVGAHSWSYRSDNPICTRTPLM